MSNGHQRSRLPKTCLVAQSREGRSPGASRVGAPAPPGPRPGPRFRFLLPLLSFLLPLVLVSHGRAAGPAPAAPDYAAVDELFRQHCLDCHAAQDPEIMREMANRTENTTMSSSERTCRFAAILLASVLVTSWLGCKQEAASTPARPIPEVPVVTVSPQTVPDEPEFIGQTEASRPVEIRSQVTGILKERFFAEGRDVKQGDRLYQIDPIPFKAAMSSANARQADLSSVVCL